MSPLGSFGYILRYAGKRGKAQGRAFSFIMHQQRYTMIGGSIVESSKVVVVPWGDSSYLQVPYLAVPCL